MSQARIPGWIYVVVIPLINIFLAALAAAFVFWYIDVSPIEAVVAMARGAFGDSYGLGYTLYYTTSFIFTGLAVAVAFHCGLFNIGVEGQAYMGALGGTGGGLSPPSWNRKKPKPLPVSSQGCPLLCIHCMLMSQFRYTIPHQRLASQSGRLLK